MQTTWAVQFTVACWLVLSDRNFQVHGGGKSGRNFWAGAEAFLSKFEAASYCSKLPQSAVSCSLRWSPQAAGFIVNVDAALNILQGSFAAGIVIRDSEGKLVQAAAKCFLGAVKVDLAEAICYFKGDSTDFELWFFSFHCSF
ncbi:hypothetical protein ACOSQ3_029719 [Xanthoceras sorbifolium]